MSIAFLVSGNLGLDVLKQIFESEKPLFVATDSKSIAIVNFCISNDIPVFKGNPRDGKLASFIKARHFQVNLLISVNYLFIIQEDVLQIVEEAVNLHGSLLPKYRGRTPHVWAIINNEKSTGVTAHIIDKGCDTGDIILQQTLTIDDHMTGADVLREYSKIYPLMVKDVIHMYRRDQLVRRKQDESKASYFGKRTPEDGLINWEWQRERIRNWVRAQAFPYPGAFSFVKGVKITIDEVIFSDLGYHQDQANGSVLSIDENNSLYVKTPNGVLKISKIRNPELISINIGDTLGNR